MPVKRVPRFVLYEKATSTTIGTRGLFLVLEWLSGRSIGVGDFVVVVVAIVFCPLQVGLAVVERAVAGHARSLLLKGKGQDISARGARNLRHAITKTL